MCTFTTIIVILHKLAHKGSFVRHESSQNNPNTRYPIFVGISPFPVTLAAAESTATAIIESWSQITNSWFLIINGMPATTIRVIKAPTLGAIETAIQKGNPWYKHCHHRRIFLLNHVWRFFLRIFDCRCASKEFIPIDHQGEITGYRIHLFPQCLCATNFSTRNSWPYRKKVYQCE